MKIAAAVFGAASLLVAASADSEAQEYATQPLGLATGAPEVVLVLEGCGPGFARNRFGRCQPRAYRYGRGSFYGGYGYGRPYGYGYGYGYGYRRGFY